MATQWCISLELTSKTNVKVKSNYFSCNFFQNWTLSFGLDSSDRKSRIQVFLGLRKFRKIFWYLIEVFFNDTLFHIWSYLFAIIISISNFFFLLYYRMTSDYTWLNLIVINDVIISLLFFWLISSHLLPFFAVPSPNIKKVSFSIR